MVYKIYVSFYGLCRNRPSPYKEVILYNFISNQVEIEETGNFLTDHSDSILIFKHIVDELNKQVKLLGREKLERMRQNMDFKRGIHLLEWEHRKLRMQAEDLQKKAKEIQTLKLTKEVQIRMQESQSVGGNNKADMELLEKTLEYKKRAHESRVSILTYVMYTGLKTRLYSGTCYSGHL